jgi:hypothetical protein
MRAIGGGDGIKLLNPTGREGSRQEEEVVVGAEAEQDRKERRRRRRREEREKRKGKEKKKVHYSAETEKGKDEDGETESSSSSSSLVADGPTDRLSLQATHTHIVLEKQCVQCAMWQHTQMQKSQNGATEQPN